MALQTGVAASKVLILVGGVGAGNFSIRIYIYIHTYIDTDTDTDIPSTYISLAYLNFQFIGFCAIAFFDLTQ